MDIKGNEKADEEAKKAAQERPQRQQTPPQYKLKSAQVPKINEDINKVARETWNHGKKNARQQRKLTRPRRFKGGVRLYGELSRKQLATLIRLRTGHCRLNSYLSRLNVIEDPTCEQCERRVENIKYFLLLCKKYEGPRNELKKNVGGRNMRVENLLGDPKLVKYTLEYVEKTILYDSEARSIGWRTHSRGKRRQRGAKLDRRTLSRTLDCSHSP